MSVSLIMIVLIIIPADKKLALALELKNRRKQKRAKRLRYANKNTTPTKNDVPKKDIKCQINTPKYTAQCNTNPTIHLSLQTLISSQYFHLRPEREFSEYINKKLSSHLADDFDR